MKKLKIEKIDLLLLTHTHYDHAGNAKSIKDAYQARVAVHLDNEGKLEKAPGHRVRPFPSRPWPGKFP